MQAATLTADSVQLWRIAEPPVRVPATARLMDDLHHVVVTPGVQPLDEATAYAVVVTDAVLDLDGRPIVAMPAGALLKAQAAVARDGASEVGAVDDHDARKLEASRTMLAPLLEQRGRERVVAAWPFRTLSITPRIAQVVGTAGALGLAPAPSGIASKTPAQALAEFPLAITSLLGVERVVTGTIASPYFLDDTTRARRPDGGHRVEPVPWMMTVPRNLPAGPAPVVIFGHAIMTERRFVLALGDALAQRGFVAVTIDFPFHGTRTHCIAGGPISVVDPRTGELSSVPPCQAGTTCNPQGRCVDASGQGNRLTMWPALNYPVASGAAFLELEHIASTKDHFDQAVIDVGALERSLREADWSAVIGRPVDRARIYYAGQSLGGIIGATFLAGAPGVRRAVLNVPGADLVDMFDDSTWFGPQVDGFFTRQGIERTSFEGERFLDVARWIVDAVDPQNLGPAIGARDLLLQMATLDFIIPNAYTRTLERVTGAPRRDYIAEHGFLVVPIEPEFARGGRDMASYLAGELSP